MTKVQLFVELQENAEQEQNLFGEVADSTITRLTEVADTLSQEELNEAISLWTSKG